MARAWLKNTVACTLPLCCPRQRSWAPEALFELARQAKQRSWWQAYADVMPSKYANLIGLEAEAAEIRTYQAELIHGLLQTEDYARAVIRAGRPGDIPEQVDRRVEIWMTRQQILNRDDPPRLRVVLNEAAVRRIVGSPAVVAALAGLTSATQPRRIGGSASLRRDARHEVSGNVS